MSYNFAVPAYHPANARIGATLGGGCASATLASIRAQIKRAGMGQG